MVAAIVTEMVAATTATGRLDGNATATVMDGNGWCNGNATATMAMEGVQEDNKR